MIGKERMEFVFMGGKERFEGAWGAGSGQEEPTAWSDAARSVSGKATCFLRGEAGTESNGLAAFCEACETWERQWSIREVGK